MKAYTDLNQSRKLAGILPHKSADGTWEKVSICGAKVDIPEDMQYRHKEIPFSFFSGVGIPSWSLAALQDIIKINYRLEKTFFDQSDYCTYSLYDTDEPTFRTVEYDNPVDACYEMILKLND